MKNKERLMNGKPMPNMWQPAGREKTRNTECTIVSNRMIAAGTYEMIVKFCGVNFTCENDIKIKAEQQDKIGQHGSTYLDKFINIKPGQFINIKLDGFYLRRPISICDWDRNTITIIYKTVGRGTEAMREYETGRTLDVLLPL